MYFLLYGELFKFTPHIVNKDYHIKTLLIMKYLLVLLLTILSFSVQAQKLTIPQNTKYITMQKDIVDSAYLSVYYEVWIRPDSTKLDKYKKGQTILKISDNYTNFCDYYHLMVDSLGLYLDANKKNRQDQQTQELFEASIGNIKWYMATMNNIKTETTLNQFYTGINAYEYTFDTPKIAWNLVQGDSIIANHRCKKATGHYAGRNYIAWYTEDTALPYGPYIFGGLPGLIIEIYDTNQNYIFTFNGMEHHPNHKKEMYNYKKSFIDRIKTTSRETALTAWKNETENYRNLSVEHFKEKKLVNGRWIRVEANFPKQPSNLLELVW